MSLQGIYCYTDTKTNEIVYIGKDSMISKKNRHYAHISKKAKSQQIDKVIQNNPNRYRYDVLCEGRCDNDLLNTLEMGYIAKYTPKFNYTKGGEGNFGFKHSEKTKQKISESLQGHTVSEETRVKLSRKNRLYTHTPEAKQKISERQTNHPMVNLSKTRNSTGFYRVSKCKDPTCKQGFIFAYRYNVDKKPKRITATTIERLKEKVLSKNLEWIEFDKEEE